MRDTARQLVDLAARQGEKAEVYVHESHQATAQLVDGKVRSCETRQAASLDTRLISRGRIGFFRTTDAVDPGMILDRARQAAAIGQEVGFDFPGPSDGPEVDSFDTLTQDMSLEDLADRGRQMTAALKKVEPGAQVKAGVERQHRHTFLVNSQGTEIMSKNTAFRATVMAARVTGDDVTLTYHEFSRTAPPRDLLEIPTELGRLLDLSRTKGHLAPGRYPVIFSPRVAFALFFPLLMGVDGANVLRGVSPLADRLGDRIADPRLTVVDDPTYAGSPDSSSHDGEGIPSRTTPVLEGGVLRSFLYDLKTAWQAGREPTGHGRRQPGSQPRAGMSNVIVTPGEKPAADLIKGIRRGLYVDQLIGLGATNLLAGVLSNPVGLGFAVENGEITGRVKDLSIAGNTHTMLRDSLGGLSRERQWLGGPMGGSMLIPYVQLNDVSVVSKG